MNEHDPREDDPDDLEARLRAWRPADVPRGLNARLRAARPSARWEPSLRGWGVALAAAALATGLALAIRPTAPPTADTPAEIAPAAVRRTVAAGGLPPGVSLVFAENMTMDISTGVPMDLRPAALRLDGDDPGPGIVQRRPAAGGKLSLNDDYRF